MIEGHIKRTVKAKIWMPINGRKPLKISVSAICAGATDFK